MFIKKRSSGNISSMQMMEILHIDMFNSRKVYKQYGLNPQQKSQAQQLLKDFFQMNCSKYNGELMSWSGDGGFAFFNSSKDLGNSVKAGKNILKRLSLLNPQTAQMLGLKNPQDFKRDIKLAAHRGEIYITDTSDVNSADPKDFDDFIKYIKKFTPIENEFFITSQVWDILLSSEREYFQSWKPVKTTFLKTQLYRLRNISKITRKPKSNNTEYINFLQELLENHTISIAARNQITLNLIKKINKKSKRKNKPWISYKEFIQLILNALHYYLSEAFSHNFRVSYWTLSNKGNGYVRMVGYKRSSEEETKLSTRCFSLKNDKYMICKAISSGKSIAVPSVPFAHQQGLWFYFDNEQKTSKRKLLSSLVIPVYTEVENSNKKILGALCLDSDKLDTFEPEEINFWRDRLIHYLINFVLAEALKTGQTRLKN